MHRLRSALSITGVVGAVATILSSTAIIEGGRREAIDAIGTLGERHIVVRSRGANPTDERHQQAPALQLKDLSVVRARVPAVAASAASRTARVELVAGTRHALTEVVGVTPDWSRVVDVTVVNGRWLSHADLRERRRVLVLGAALAARLTDNSLAMGTHVRVGGDWYEVIGVLTPRRRGRSAVTTLQRFDLDQAAFAPFATVDWRLGPGDSTDRADEFVIQVRDALVVEEAARQLGGLLPQLVGAAEAEALEIIVPREVVRARLTARRSFDVMLLGVSLVALLISGVAIMNIMLVSVSERTQEIGVRRACGARAADIRCQFTLEATLLAVGGACGGLALGFIIVLTLGLAGWSTGLSASAVAMAIGVVAVTGLLCGVYPACRAAKLAPAAALRAP